MGCWFGNGFFGGWMYVIIIIWILGCIFCKIMEKIVNLYYCVFEKKIVYMWNLVLIEIYILIKKK